MDELQLLWIFCRRIRSNFENRTPSCVCAIIIHGIVMSHTNRRKVKSRKKRENRLSGQSFQVEKEKSCWIRLFGQIFNKKRFGFLKSNVNKRFWTSDQLTNQQRICKEATASKHVLYTISTIHFLLSDSLNKYEEHLEGWRCTLKILNFQGHF